MAAKSLRAASTGLGLASPRSASPQHAAGLQHARAAGALLTGREPKCSWEQGQVCVIKNKQKKKKKAQQIAYLGGWTRDALHISSNSCWDYGYCSGTSQKQEGRNAFLPTEPHDTTGARKKKERLWICPHPGPWQPARPWPKSLGAHGQRWRLAARSVVQRAHYSSVTR